MFYRVGYPTKPGIVNLDFVTRITVEEVGPHCWEVCYFLEDGSVVTDSEVYDWPEIPAPMIAAQPGYFVLTCWDESPVPIIGWIRQFDGEIFPKTFNIELYGGCHPILVPDGRVFDGLVFPDEAAWRAAERRRKQEEKDPFGQDNMSRRAERVKIYLAH